MIDQVTKKKKTALEIIIFLLITFGLMLPLGFKAYNTEVIDGTINFLYMICSFSPAIGCIVARYFFRKGFKDDILFPEFTGHFRGYLLSILLPLGYGIFNCIMITIISGAGFTIKYEEGILGVLANVSLLSAEAYIAFFVLIGEELGWRAFLYDKLESLVGIHGSIIVGGIIWGLWHIPPLVVMGLNYGKSVPGFPVTNVLLMCVMCIGIGAMLQMLRRMTDSVIAPIIAHALIDTVCNGLAMAFLNYDYAADNEFLIGCCLTADALIIGIPCWIYMIKRKR